MTTPMPVSSVSPKDPDLPTDDRLYLVRSSPGRWDTAAIAAALALPYDTRNGVREWELLLNFLDDAVRLARALAPREADSATWG